MNNTYIILVALLGINVYCQENRTTDQTSNQPAIAAPTNNTQSTIQQSLPSDPAQITQSHTEALTQKKEIWQKDIEQHHNDACIRRINKLYTQVK